jgi:hypothetical protein
MDQGDQKPDRCVSDVKIMSSHDFLSSPLPALGIVPEFEETTDLHLAAPVQFKATMV